jgi:putative ATP-binding cassette transporter
VILIASGSEVSLAIQAQNQLLAEGIRARAVSMPSWDIFERHTPLLRGVAFAVDQGDGLLIAGPSGSGKSTLLRAIAGIWPFGRGRIRLGKGQIAFVPQRPYLPLGTLAEVLLYPTTGKISVPVDLPAVLHEVGLGALADELDKVENWSARLSLGEQQAIVFARFLLTKPKLLFLDEATSALDETTETHLLGLLRTKSWRPTVVSVGHGAVLRNFHEQTVDLCKFEPTQEAVVAQHTPGSID